MKKLIIAFISFLFLSGQGAVNAQADIRKVLTVSDSLSRGVANAINAGDYIQAQQLGEQNVKLLKKSIIEDNEFTAKGLHLLAKAYATTGNWNAAWKNADASAKMWKALYSAGNLNYAMALGDAAYYNARRANYSYAKNDATKALEVWELQEGTDAVVESSLLHGLAFAHFLVGEYDDTKSLANKAVSRLADSGNKNTPQYGIALSLLAAVTSRTESTQDNAIAFANSALAVQQKLLPEICFDKAVTMSRLSLALLRKGSNDPALEYGLKALEIWDSLHTVPVEYEDCAWLMATMLNANHKYDRALALCNRLIDHAEAAGAVNSLQYANLLAGSAISYYGMEQFDNAVKLQQKSIGVVERVKSKEHTSLPAAYHNYALYLLKGGNAKEAVKAQMQSVKVCEKIFKNKPQHADALSRLAVIHSASEDYKLAAAAEEKSVAILSECGDLYAADYLNGLNNLASYKYRADDAAGALTVEEKVIEQYKSKGDTVQKNFSTALANAGLYASKCGNSPLAIEYQRRSLSVLKRVILPTEDPYTEGLTLLVKYCTESSNYADASVAQKELAELYARKYGARSPEYASKLELLASMLSLDKRLDEAIAVQEQVAGIYSSADIDEESRTNAINTLAKLHSKAGHYDEASRISSQVTDAGGQSGEYSPEQAERLMQAASHQQLAGNHAEALRLSARALEVLEHTSAKGGKQHAHALSDLAGYYAMVHNNDYAVSYAAQASSIYEAIGDTANFATSLSNLALFQARAGNSVASDSLNNRALELVGAYAGTRSPEYARILNNMASNIYSVGNIDRAEEVGREALDIFAENGLQTTPEYANVLNNQSVYLLGQDRTKEALELIDQSIDIRRNTLGTKHPEYLHAVVNNCSMLATIPGEEQRLVERASESTALLTDMLRRQFSSLPAAERASYWDAWNNWYRADLLSYASACPTPRMISVAYEGTLFAKGLMLNSECNLKDLIAEASSADIDLLYTRLQDARAKLNELYENLSASGELNELNVTDSLERAANALERELVSKSGSYGDYTANLNVPASAVRSALQPNEAAVEFVAFGAKNRPNYYAFVMTGEDSVPKFIEVASTSALNNVRSNRTELSRLVWENVAQQLPDGINTLYFAPDGDLYSLPIEYLPDFASPSSLLSSRWSMHRLSSTRQLARRGQEAQLSAACVVGGIDYNPDGTPSGYDLPQTLVEVNGIHGRLQPKVPALQLLTGKAGSERAIRGLSGKRTSLLHIATHGFCISEEDADYQACDLFLSNAPGAGHAEDNMLRRSGLMLYGAAPTLLGRGTSDSSNDGVLTAMEIARLDLRGLDLAVLSACQTALGDVTGEGVFGLQRGFKKAGAKSLLMSLWKVDDYATCLLMDRFYANLVDGMSKHNALAEAQEYLRNYKAEAQDWSDDEMFDPDFEDEQPQDEYPYRNPQFWSAFVLLDAI